MISCVSWVPKGVSAPNPKRFQVSQAEREMAAKMQHEMSDGNEEVQTETVSEEDSETMPSEKNVKNDGNGLPSDLRMDEYSSDEDDDGAGLGNLLVGQGPREEPLNEDDTMPENIDNMVDSDSDNDNSKSKSSDDDSDDDDSDDDLDDVPDTREFMPIDLEGMQAMSLANIDAEYYDDADGEEASDIEDTQIKDTDAVVLISKTEEDFSTVEVHLYETKTGNMYIHHDISLPSFPLCLAHGKSVGESKGNYCAVGMFTPGIEIWNLDVLDALEPVCVLGGTSATKTSKKSKKSTETLVNGSHSDAIMALSWNPIHRNILASASADTTVKLWDVSSDPIDKTGVMGPAATFSHHTDKVQAVQWHPTDGSILATGSFDKSVAIVDARCKDGGNFRKARLPADCESIAWDPCQTHNLSVACEDGTVICWDVRNGFGEKDGESWSFVAHDFGGVSDLAYNRHVPGLMATVAIDKTVALWDTHQLSKLGDGTAERPHPCSVKDMKVGKLYTVSFYPSSPWLLGCGGAGGDLALWDMSSEEVVHKRFESRIAVDVKGDTATNEEKNAETFDFNSILQDASAKKVRDTMEKKQKPNGKSKKKKAHRR